MRKGIWAAVAVALAVAAGTAIVFACSPIPTLNVDKVEGPAGSTVTLTGTTFGRAVDGASAVAVRWDTASGPILAQVVPDAGGAVGPLTVTIPANAKPGYHVLIGTQTDGNGAPWWGTTTFDRTRLVFQVTGPGMQPVGMPVGLTTGAPALHTATGLNAATTALVAGLGVLGLGLFGFGVGTFARTFRRAPAVARTGRSRQ